VLFAIAACGVLTAGRARSVPAACAGAGLIGLGMGAEADLMPYLISRYFGLRAFSELFGYVFSAYAVAGALGPWLMGQTFDRFHSYSAAVPVFGAAMLLSALLMPPYAGARRV
jgi:cyanate permease